MATAAPNYSALEWVCIPVAGPACETHVAADHGDVVARHSDASGLLEHEMLPEQAREIGLAYLAMAMRAEAGEEH